MHQVLWHNSHFSASTCIVLGNGSALRSDSYIHYFLLSINDSTSAWCLSPFLGLLVSSSKPISKRLEHSNWTRGIRWLRLDHIPMLDNTCPIHSVQIHEGHGRIVVNPNMDETQVVVKAPTENVEVGVRDDGIQLGCQRITSMWVVGAVLYEVDISS
jgi:hypothetical protein